MDVESKLKQLKDRQNQWMRERQAELDHHRVVAELQQSSTSRSQAVAASPASTTAQAAAQPAAAPAAGGGPCSAGALRLPPTVQPEEVINKLTERLADRIRNELRAELQQEASASTQQKQQEAAQLEGFLAKEIESHTCPICYELMAPPNNSPILLFPCGHTFCNRCITAHIDQHRRNICPFCRETIQSQAPNFSLQQLIHNFISERHRVAVPPPSVSSSAQATKPLGEQEQPTLSAADEHARIRRDHDSKAVRLRVLANELADAEAEDAATCQRLAAASAVTGHLRRERAAAVERLRAVQAEVKLAEEQLQGAVEKQNTLSQQRESIHARKELVRRTLEPLAAEVEKLEVLLGGLLELQE